METLFDEIQPSDVVWDVGANVGGISTFVGQLLDDGRLVAFDPLPANANALRENLARNGIDSRVFEYALGDETGETEFVVSKTPAPGDSHAVVPNRRTSGFWRDRTETIPVNVIRGDELIEKYDLDVPNLIKFDIEGAELNAIRGLRETLSDDSCRTVVCEVHAYLLEDYGGTAAELEDELERAGFELERFDERTQIEDGERLRLYRLLAKK
ncbi:FkbM family methyltransferase [Haloplanus sp. GCM10025708]